MVDIIIPAYNAHATIENTLNSILVQYCLKDIKVYVVDDGSDKSYNDCYNKFKNKMDITMYVLPENKGPRVFQTICPR